MLTQEELAVKIKLITQNAWHQESNTTINSMIEYIVRESLNIVLAEINDEFDFIHENYTNNPLDNKDNKNGSKDGGISQPQRHEKAPTSRNSTDARRRK